jgi:hypothetical protein
MSRRLSFLVSGATAMAMTGVAVMLFAVPASANDVTVAFSGGSPLLGLPLLACASSPNDSSISMTTIDTLNVQNQTGQKATVYINGDATTHTVTKGHSVPITFPAGSWTVTLVPNCALNLADAGKVSVQVMSPTRSAPPTPTPPTRTTGPIGPIATTKPSHRRASPTHSSTTSAPSVAPTPIAAPSSADASPQPGTTAPPAGPSASPVPSTASGSAPSTQTTEPTTGGTSILADGPESVTIGAAQALPASDIKSAPDYLLAVVALILVLGVGSASVRAVVNQRRTRGTIW